ncbi:thiopeptide-type bacteriocin biosynthesis protein [Sphingobacterium puteale]|uniref:lantibiotic dehydratase n=1 Tax=Sphingobacterium puteale TaxID=2420510 RepID=UPI003D9710D3
MIKLQLNQNVIVRTPRLPIDAMPKEFWPELKEMIKEASLDFWELIRLMSYDEFETADEKIKKTVQKYFNRAKFRATPYGSFASIGITQLGRNKDQLRLSDQLLNHSFISWKDKPQAKFSINIKTESFIANSTFYKVGREIRFLKKEGEEFEIAAIDYDPGIITILEFCKDFKTYSELNSHFSESQTNWKELVAILVDIQLILTSQHENIVGADYFERTGYIPDNARAKYIITERKCVSGSYFSGHFRHLPDLILKIKTIKESQTNDSLEEFVNRFNKKFEGQEVPIMVAIDPEIGVDYGDFAKLKNFTLKDRFGIKTNPVGENKKNLADGNVIDLIIQAIKCGGCVNLEEVSSAQTNNELLPNSIPILCKEIDGTIFIDSIGGATSNSLSARFAFAVQEIKDHSIHIAQIEVDANPDVLFFDVGYSCEQEVDDINRRPLIYPSLVNILNFSDYPTSLPINDITVTVKNSKVILQSRTLGKRLIPRYASAYNFNRSKLPLFRFLMDIQYQDITTDYSFSPKQILPGLSVYPRVEFRNIVVAPALWRLREDDLFNQDRQIKSLGKLRQYLISKGVTKYFKIGSGDQTLLLNTDNDQDLELLILQVKKVKQLYLEEAYLPVNASAVDHNGRKMFPQLHVTLTHTEQVFNGMNSTSIQNNRMESRQWELPVNDWLYLEFFGISSSVDSFCNNMLIPLLKRGKKGVIKWFFIRYNEGGEHIRLRIQFKSPQNAFEFIGIVNLLATEKMKEGRITDYSIRTYKKEVHRYTKELIPIIESHFYKDSLFIHSISKLNLSEFQKVKLCLETIDYIRSLGIFTMEDFEKIIESITIAYNEEFNVMPTDYRTLNAIFKDFQREPKPLLSKERRKKFESFKLSLGHTIKLIAEPLRAKLFGDLLHMHCNRLFIEDQRFYEMIVYNLSERQEKIRKATLKLERKIERRA